MADNSGEQLVRKCTRLKPSEADSIFFPGPGGKSNKAKAFCSDCPVIDSCLKGAISNGSEGFLAGTTFEQRKDMAKFLYGLSTIEPINLDDYVAPVVQHKQGRRIKRKVEVHPYSYLDEIEPSIEELIG